LRQLNEAVKKGLTKKFFEKAAFPAQQGTEAFKH